MLLVVHLGDLWLRVNFGAFNILAVPIHIGTSYLDRFMKNIFPMEPKIFLGNFGLVSIVFAYVHSVMSIEAIDIATASIDITLYFSVSSVALSWMPKQFVVPPNTEIVVTEHPP